MLSTWLKQVFSRMVIKLDCDMEWDTVWHIVLWCTLVDVTKADIEEKIGSVFESVAKIRGLYLW